MLHIVILIVNDGLIIMSSVPKLFLVFHEGVFESWWLLSSSFFMGAR